MHPTLFEIGSRAIPSYGFFLTLGYLASIVLIILLAKRQKLPLVETAAYALFGLAVSLLGAKLYLVILRISRELIASGRLSPGALDWPEGGGGFYGGLIAGIAFSLWYLRRFSLPFWKVADIVGAATALGYSLMRIGCFLGGCCYGRPTSLPWGIQFPHLDEPVHPTQLYESGLNLVNFLILLAVLRNKKFDGQVISLDILINCSIRFVVEYFRGDAGRGWVVRGGSPYSSLTVPQLICLVGLLVGLTLYATLGKRRPALA